MQQPAPRGMAAGSLPHVDPITLTLSHIRCVKHKLTFPCTVVSYLTRPVNPPTLVTSFLLPLAIPSSGQPLHCVLFHLVCL